MKLGSHIFALVLLLLLSSAVSRGQTPEVLKAQNALDKVLFDSGISFREGLIAYEDNNLSEAAKKFNNSVEVFINSTFNLQREPKLQGCYDRLIETIYRIEFPSDNRLPDVRNLAQTCNWNNPDAAVNIENNLSDRIANLVKSKITKRIVTVANDPSKTTKPEKVGFNSIQFEPSPLDELSRLELTPDEKDIENNPVAQQQYQYIQYAVSNKSLGFIVIKAKAGETVAKLAKRHRVKAIDVAKFNGLLPTSVLGAGREIKIPTDGETWQAISNRTGVSVTDLIAANPGMTTPRGKVFVPVTGNVVQNIIYSRPTNLNSPTVNNIKVVKAKGGDTVERVAQRYNVNPTEVAKYNGLLLNTVLPRGREIKIPSISINRIEYVRPKPQQVSCNNSTSPIVQKLRLGLTVLEVSQILGRKIVLRKNNYSIYDLFYTQILNLKGLYALYLSFYKGKLYWLDVTYDKSIEWNGVDEFQSSVSKSLDVPNSWILGDTSKERMLRCKGFELRISQTLTKNYELRLVDRNALSQMYSDWNIKQEKIINDQDKKKAAFKP